MFDILATMGVAAVSEIIKQTVSKAIEWAKGRKKPPAAVVAQKVEQFVADATKKFVPDALTPDDRRRIVSGLIDVVRPTLDEVMRYSPNTARIVRAAQAGSGPKRAAAKKVAGKKAAVKKAAMKKTAAKKTAHKKMR